MNRLNEIDHIFRQVLSINSIDDYWKGVYKIIFYQNAALINAIRKPWKDGHIPTPEGVGLSLMLPSEHSGV